MPSSSVHSNEDYWNVKMFPFARIIHAVLKQEPHQSKIYHGEQPQTL
jgi:hypothetical protein